MTSTTLRNSLTTITLLTLAACGDNTTTMPAPDLTAPAIPDLSMMMVTHDLAVAPPDLASTDDLTTSDLTPLRDLAPAPDLVVVAPTCTDGVKNGDEVDVDCGGPTCTALGYLCSGCSNDLSDEDGDDFSATFTVMTTATVQSDLANQRGDCNGLTAGDGFWDAYMNANGTVSVTITDGTNRVDLTTTATINDGKPHSVTIVRTLGNISVLIDKALPGVSKPDTGVYLLTLPALKTGSDVCDQFGTYHALVGSVSGFCEKDTTASCDDGVKDGSETGIDCGGAICNQLGTFCGACSSDLSNIGTAAFAINLTATTTAKVQSDIANQRGDCNGLTPGDGFWDIYMNANGTVSCTITDGTKRADLTTTATINDGQPHVITLVRNAGAISLLIDKLLPAATKADPGISLATLTALKIGSDVCDQFGTYHALVGSVTGPCMNSTTPNVLHSALNNSKCLDLSQGATANGTKIDLYDCNNTPAQKWNIVGGVLHSALLNSKCLDVSQGATANGTAIDLYDCNGTASQMWNISNGVLKSALNNAKCLDVTQGNTANGTAIDLYDCNGTASQIWSITN